MFHQDYGFMINLVKVTEQPLMDVDDDEMDKTVNNNYYS